ncbi:hypothetical protein FACS1894208_06790 [Clostridia bacterium]|nr:hypothetical protein FACS1894208_06790 [Clostridia bacterium]
MDRLCFGTFAKSLQSAMQKPNSNQAVVELLLDLVAEDADEGELSEDFSVKPKTVNRLMNFIDNVHEDIVALSSAAKVITAMPKKFKSKIFLVAVLVDDLIEGLRKLITADKSIAPAKRDELLALAKKELVADFLSAVYLYALNKPNKIALKNNDMEVSAELVPQMSDVRRLNEIYARFPRPADIDVPTEPSDEEMAYITELLSAYAEAEGVSELSRSNLAVYPKYNNDLRHRRKEYYAAETIRRGTREVFGETDPDQFDLLIEETYEGIYDIHSQSYSHGYERLLKVMAQVTAIQINKCPLSQLPEWIGNKEKKGVCHILVNDGTIRWVVRDE